MMVLRGLEVENFYGDDILEMKRIFEPFKNLFPNGVRVVFNARMRTTLGRAWYNKGLIEMNINLIAKHPEELMPTFAHELGHLIARQTHGKKIRAHGPEWKKIVKGLGFKPTRTHDLDVSEFKRSLKTIAMHCHCDTHMVTKRKYVRIISGQAAYRCKSCKGSLK